MSAYTTFKVDYHQVYIQGRKDPKQKWHDFSYLVTETNVQEVVACWPPEWHAPSDLVVGRSIGAKSAVAKKRKEVAKQTA